MTEFDQSEVDTACDIIHRYASHLGVRPSVAANVITQKLKTYVSNDLRIKRWRIRLFIFDERDEYVADTDPTIDAHLPGTIILSGINNVIAYCADTCAAFHKHDRDPIISAFSARYATLRVMLSTGGGGASWRIPYFVDGKRFLARVEIRREDGSR